MLDFEVADDKYVCCYYVKLRIYILRKMEKNLPIYKRFSS